MIVISKNDLIKAGLVCGFFTAIYGAIFLVINFGNLFLSIKTDNEWINAILNTIGCISVVIMLAYGILTLAVNIIDYAEKMDAEQENEIFGDYNGRIER